MLTSGRMVGFVLTKDYDKARAFYEGKLGFEFVSVDQFALVMKAGAHHIRIAKVPDFTPVRSTVLGWEVADIAAVAAWLKERGVAMEAYPFVQDKELRDLDRADGRQGGVVQRPGWECAFGEPARMKIREIRAFGLYGCTPEGGWSNELKPEDCVHTILAVLTDEGRTGWGSVFTSVELVRASLSVLRPLYQDENALEPERVSEKLHQNTFWQGRGGSITHTIGGIDMALWDLLGKGRRSAGGASAGRAVSRSRAAVCVAADAGAGANGGRAFAGEGPGISSFQDRMGAVRQEEHGG